MLNNKLDTIAGFKEFHEADTVEPKDEKLNFVDFKTLVSVTYPDYNEEILKAVFDKVTNTSQTIDFDQYQKSLLYIKNPDFKLFYQSDSSSPKDWYLTFDEWKVEAHKILPTASTEEFKAYFYWFKGTDINDSNIEELKFEEFTKALMAVRDQKTKDDFLLANTMKTDLDFKAFYDQSSSEPKDSTLNFAEFKTLVSLQY